MPPKINKILGFYTANGEKNNMNEDYSYAQIELLGKHARSIKERCCIKSDINNDNAKIDTIDKVIKDDKFNKTIKPIKSTKTTKVAQNIRRDKNKTDIIIGSTKSNDSIHFTKYENDFCEIAVELSLSDVPDIETEDSVYKIDVDDKIDIDDGDGYIMLVSKEDLNLVMNYQWYLTSDRYPATYGSVDSGGERWGAPYPLHRFLVQHIPIGYVVDHINRNRLDNRRTNLRVITAKQNSYNRKKPKNSKNKYKGVRKMGKGKFKAVISKDGKTYEIPDCETEKQAALAYDMIAEQLFGDHAGKNFPS